MTDHEGEQMEPAKQNQGPPPYGALIRLAREAKGWSPEAAAANMPFRFSGTSWRQIETGYKGRDRKPVSTKPSTLAAMARTVGITADRLEEHHPEAAKILREMERQEVRQSTPMPAVLNAAPAHVRRMIEAALEDVDPEDRPDLLREMAADYEAVMKQRARKSSGTQRPRHAG